MRRLLALILGTLSMFHAAPHEVVAASSLAIVHAYTYDAPARPSTEIRAVAERGPPCTTCDYTTDDAVDRGSRGPSARPSGTATRGDMTYIAPVSPAQAVTAMATTGRQVVVAGGGLCALQRVDVAANDGARIASRADELTGALDPIAQTRRTSAVMSTREGADVLAGGGVDLSPAQRALAQGGDVLGRMRGAHAEITAMDAAGKAGLTPWQMAVSRPICPACQAAIEGSGGTVAPGGTFAWWPW